MSNVVQTIATIGGLGALIGLQTFWIARALDQIDHRIDRIDGRSQTRNDELRVDLRGGLGDLRTELRDGLGLIDGRLTHLERERTP